MSGTGVIRPFEARSRRPDDPDPVHDVLRAAGPVAVTELPGGTTAWVVTDRELARAVLNDPRFSKDTALAPPGTPDLEATAAERLSLTTAEGPTHTLLRRAHAPMLTHRAVARHAPAVTATCREQLHALGPGEVDLMAGFTTRYPLSVVLDLVGAPPELLDDAAAACRAMWSADPAESGAAFGTLIATSRAAVGRPGLATELAGRLRALDGGAIGAGIDDDQVGYLVFGLVFAGQLTTDTVLGSLLAGALDPDAGIPDDELVARVLRDSPPAPFTLWRFATEPTDLAGSALPAGAPVLVDLRGIGRDAPDGGELPFGHGPHFCIGAHLARLELDTALRVLRSDFPHARLAVPASELVEHVGPGPVGGRLAALPVVLRAATAARSRRPAR